MHVHVNLTCQQFNLLRPAMVRNLNCVCRSVVTSIITWKNGWCYDEYSALVSTYYLCSKGKGVDVMSNDKLNEKDKTHTGEEPVLKWVHSVLQPGALSCTEHMFIPIYYSM